MPDLNDAAHQAKALARRGAHAATAVLDASFHPFRTVRGLANGDEPMPPPTDTASEPPLPDPERPVDPAAEPAPPRPDPERVVEEPEPVPDLPVEASGPAPHIPPRIAGEVERDYGDELPGFRNGDEPPPR